jgi:NAD(P)-dependent dehydrogenase (short-subunit alcohol dehydrogenase family)
VLLTNKVAVVYGASGAVGSVVARAFAKEGARVFATGRRPEPVERVVKDIVADGGWLRLHRSTHSTRPLSSDIWTT